jgi:Holliday junction resolvasome RuvABC endonuclease subunit
MERTRKNLAMNQLNPFRVLTNDPSLTAWGWAVIDVKSSNVVISGCIKTESQSKKRRIRKGDDTVRRISELNFELLRIIRTYNVQFVISELPHGSQNASSAVMMGVVTGLMQAIADSLDLPIEWYSEGDAKKHLLNRRSVTKEETIKAIKELYDVKFTTIKYKDEAVADAMAVYHVARSQSPILKLNLR